jgi:hypothetical protein
MDYPLKIFDPDSQTIAEVSADCPPHVVIKIKKIMAMRQLRFAMSKKAYGTAVEQRRRANARVVQVRLADGLFDPDQIKELPGRMQVSLASKKLLNSFRRGKA